LFTSFPKGNRIRNAQAEELEFFKFVALVSSMQSSATLEAQYDVHRKHFAPLI
jgi:hypothetical protein